jgi:hypothetical protein
LNESKKLSDELDLLIGYGGADMLTRVCMLSVERNEMVSKEYDGISVGELVNEFHKLKAERPLISTTEFDEALLYILLKEHKERLKDDLQYHERAERVERIVNAYLHPTEQMDEQSYKKTMDRNDPVFG